jgi:glycosyltransferase involved in cell wall biosynthesis
VGSHHLAREWSRAGHRVLFMSAPITPWHGPRAGDPLVRGRFRRGAAGALEVEPGLWDWVPIGLLPWVWGAHWGRYLGRMLPSAALGLARTLRRTGFMQPDLLLIDHPQFCNLDRIVAATRMAYRATDLYREMHDRGIVDVLERRLIAAADCAMATSEPVARRLRELGAGRPVLIENGAEVAHFARPAARPPEYEAAGPSRVVFAGAIDFRFDAELVVRLAKARPAVEFVIIGSGTGTATLAAAALRNIRLLGPRPYALLPAYLQHARAGLLPLNGHPANAGRSPMKLYEYAAAGIPVLATRTEDLARRAPAFVRFLDPNAPEASLDSMLQAPPRPDAGEVATHDWSRIAEVVLATTLAASARHP